MSMELDVNNFVSALKMAYDATGEVPYYIYTDGEEYLYREVIKKCISGEALYASDIDFEAFDEDERQHTRDYEDDAVQQVHDQLAHYTVSDQQISRYRQTVVEEVDDDGGQQRVTLDVHIGKDQSAAEGERHLYKVAVHQSEGR